MTLKPILNPPVDYTAIGQDKVELVQAAEVEAAVPTETVGTIESGLVSTEVQTEQPVVDAGPAPTEATEPDPETATTRGRRR